MWRCTSATTDSVVSAGHASLVGDDEHSNAGAIQQTNTVYRPGIERHLLHALEIVHFFNQRPISIEKKRR